MAWQGKSLGEICRQLKDPARNRRTQRKRKACGLTVLAAITALAISGPASGGFEGEIQGGKGGGFFKVNCPPGQFWVGADGAAGFVIDRMKLLCEQFRTVD